MTLDYPPQIRKIIEGQLKKEPGLKQFFDRLEKSVETNPEWASPETILLRDGRKITCRRKSVRATSYSKNMCFSKDEIVMLYEILPDRIRIISVFFP